MIILIVFLNTLCFHALELVLLFFSSFVSFFHTELPFAATDKLASSSWSQMKKKLSEETMLLEQAVKAWKRPFDRVSTLRRQMVSEEEREGARRVGRETDWEKNTEKNGTLATRWSSG